MKILFEKLKEVESGAPEADTEYRDGFGCGAALQKRVDFDQMVDVDLNEMAEQWARNVTYVWEEQTRIPHWAIPFEEYLKEQLEAK